MSQRLRIFISSPGDVQEERLRAHLVVQKVARDYARFFDIEAYLWEHEPMLASGHFQDAIEPPSASDIVVLVVYSRLGTPLPERSVSREYRGIDGRSPVTGTEWEFEEALEANRARGAPDLLAYRKIGDPGTSLSDAAKRIEQERQWQGLEAFWHRHFETGTVFLAGSAKFKTLEEFDQKLESDLVALIEARIEKGLATSSQTAEAVWLRGSPFRGLASYDFADAPIFFGRDAQTRNALTRLQAAAGHGSAFLLLLGASGSGKSSVARAGILPSLLAPKAIQGVGVWRRVVMRPGEGDQDPVLGLARALIHQDVSGGVGLPELVGSPDEVNELAAHLAASADDPAYPFRQALNRVIEEERRTKALLPHETARLVLLVDQMEELFTRRVDPARRDLFVRILAGLARSGCVWVVATMRNDLWHRAVEIPQLVALVEASARLDLLPPDGSQIIEIIRRSAAAAGLTFETESESGVALDAVIAQAAAAEPGVLPLLSVMLESLYQRDVASSVGGAKSRHELRFATYRDLGELKGAIARRADEVLDGLAATDPEGAAALPQVLRALVTASGPGGALTSRPARIDSFADGSPEARLVAAMLSAEARLLVASTTEHGAEVRLAHEALIENWPRASEQLARDRRDLETRSRLEALLRRWKGAANADEQKRATLTGLNLAEASDLIQRWNIGATEDLAVFAHASERADQWRRRRLLVAASVLLCVFAGLAGLASLQWRRAESEAQSALRAQETEKQARSVAETERARATANEERATDALRATRRETAQTLAAQVQLASGQHDVRRALALAVQAGNLEKDALRPGERPASEPALLQALAGAREVLHIKGASQTWWMPYAFLDDVTLVYADARSGVVLVDLRQDAKINARIPLPEAKPVNHLATLPSRGLVVIATAQELVVVDTRARQITARIPFGDRINSLDVDPEGHKAAVAVGSAIALIDLDKPGAPALIDVPDAQPAMKVGQVRFARSGAALLVTYGIKVLDFDVAKNAFAGAVGELSGTGMGVDQPTLDAVLSAGTVAFVHVVPDLGTSSRILTFAPLELQAIETGERRAATLGTENPDLEFRGMTAIDQERTGHPTTIAAILSQTRDDRQEFQLRYVSGKDGLILAKDGRLMPPFASVLVPPGDLANQKPSKCQVSEHASFLACQYWTKDSQGLVVWRLLGGNHQFERVAERYKASFGVLVGENDLLATTDKGLVSVANGIETKLADLSEDWRLGASEGRDLVALAPKTKQGQIFRLTENHHLETALQPIPATGMVLVPGTDRVLVQQPDRLSLVDIATGRSIWTAPIGDLRHVSALKSTRQVIAIASSAAYLLDIDTGRILKSHSLALAPDGPVAPDRVGQRIAYLDSGNNASLLDLETGAAETIKDIPAGATQFAWSNDSATLLIGGKDGSVTAWTPAKGQSWLIPSPFARSFQASAWPGQPPQGVVLQIALSNDGKRVAVIRQDMPTVDIHEMAEGRLLTQLTPPWSTLRGPAQVSFGPTDEIVTAWTVHAMSRDKPRFVTAHRLPRNFDEALAAATARLAKMNTTWTPAGPRQ